MATQPQPAVRPTHQAASPTPCKAETTKLSRKSGAVTDVATSTQPGVEDDPDEEQMEPVRRAVFQRKSNRALNLPDGYLRVAVLIIRWDKSIDEFKGHCGEIQRLQGIFEDKFGYICKVHSITNQKNPQVDLNIAILNHIREHDDPNSLLIFFYTGHGNRSGNDLELSANQNFGDASDQYLPTAFWSRAEAPIMYDMQGDALSILDCCMASLAALKGGNGPPRTYQMLAASPANAPTTGPGQNSFTTALCNSLEELLAEADGGTFLLTQLAERINTKRDSQPCLSWDRLRAFKRTVQLGRLQTPILQDSPSNEDPEQSSLDLRFSFKSKDLKIDQIERLAEGLPGVFHEAKIPLRRIDWVRLTPTKREPARMPNIHHTVSFGGDDDAVLEHCTAGYVDTNNNGVFESRHTSLYSTSFAVNAAQRWRSNVKRKRDRKMSGPDLSHNAETWSYAATLSMMLAMALTIINLLFFLEVRIGGEIPELLISLIVIFGPSSFKRLEDRMKWIWTKRDASYGVS